MSVVEAGIIHAEWCGHCKSLMPEWSKFTENEVKGGSYKGITPKAYEEKADAGAIEKKGFEMGSFPKFYTITKGGKIDYPEGVGRTADGIKSWMDSLAAGGEKKSEEDTSSTDTQPSEKAGDVEKKEGFWNMFGGKKKRSKRKSNKKKTSRRKTKKSKKSKKSKRKTRRTRRK